jgi:AraC-like DNA-binding protein
MSYKLQKNDICFLRPDDIYQTDPIGTMEVINLYFTFERNDIALFAEDTDIDRVFCIERFNFTDLTLINQPFVIKAFSEGIKTAKELQSIPPKQFAEKSRNILLELLVMQIIGYQETINANRQNDMRHRLVAEITEFLDENLHEALTCAKLSEKFGYHPNYINSIVKELLGIPLHRLILEQKIKAVTAELIKTDKPISQIAQEFNFYDSSHLNRCYFGATGLKPGDIRKASKA